VSTAYRVRLHPSEEDAAVSVLWELGTDGVQVESEAPDETCLLAWFPADPDSLPARLLAAAPSSGVERVEVPDVDWVARFREGFGSFHAGGFLVVPAWETPPGDAERVIRVDPGQAFGTGTHESTQLCLAWLEELAAARELGRVLDVGAGTGILSIAAAQLGARLVVSTDLDPDAVAEASRHRLLNAAILHLVRGDGGAPFRPAAFDVVTANLTGPMLRARAQELTALLGPGGQLVIAGFLADEIEAVLDCFPLQARLRRDGEWAAAVLA
jgi:ribosomal protein L11 methyltransferase